MRMGLAGDIDAVADFFWAQGRLKDDFGRRRSLQFLDLDVAEVEVVGLAVVL